MGKSKEITYEVDEKGCHICTSHSKDRYGYIKLKRDGKSMNMHRWMYAQFVSMIPEGLIVRHKCDTPACINLEHLELGTHQDNTNDKLERGRYKTSEQKGSSNNASKLTEDIVEVIRLDTESTNVLLAERYGVTPSTISAIRHYKLWQHIG